MKIESKEYCNIIILGYKLPKLEEKCIKSIIRNTKQPYLLTFIDNHSTGKSLTEMWNMLVLTTPKWCKYICLLNNDTEVSPLWLSKMVDTLEKDPMYGFCGPSTNSCHSPQKNIPTYEQAQEHKDEYEIMKDPISGFCLVFKKKIWLTLNAFDERFKFYGSESNFIDLAQQQGYKCVWQKDSFVYHVGEASVKSSKMNVQEEREKAKKLYWGDRKKK